LLTADFGHLSFAGSACSGVATSVVSSSLTWKNMKKRDKYKMKRQNLEGKVSCLRSSSIG
jgi:hypothetical protein